MPIKKENDFFNWNVVNKLLIAALFAIALLPVFSPEGAPGDFKVNIIRSNTFLGTFAAIGITFLLTLLGVHKKIQKIKLPEKYFVPGIFFFALIICISMAWFLFHFSPHVADTYAQILQGKIFASGRFYLESEKLRDFFDVVFVNNNGKVYSQYPPGHPMMLAVFIKLGTPWLLNPLLCALSIVLVYFIAKEITDTRTARIASVIMVLSPFVMVMGAEFMSHTTSSVCALSFSLFFIKLHKTGNMKYAFLAGIFLAYMFITRPYTTVAYALPFGLYWVIFSNKNYKKLFMGGFIMLALLCGGVVFYMYYNYMTTGDMFTTGYNDTYLRDAAMQANTGKHFRASFDFTDIKRGISHYTSLQRNFFYWMCPSLIFVFTALFLKLTKKYSILMLTPIITVTVSLMFTDFNDFVFRPRYLYECSAGIAIMTALCITQLPAWIKKRFKLKTSKPEIESAIRLFIAILFVLAIPNLTDVFTSYTRNYWNGNYPLYKRLKEVPAKPALIIVGAGMQTRDLPSLFYPLDPNQPVIAVTDKGARNIEIMKQYPDRYVYYSKTNLVQDQRRNRPHYPAQQRIQYKPGGDTITLIRKPVKLMNKPE